MWYRPSDFSMTYDSIGAPPSLNGLLQHSSTELRFLSMMSKPSGIPGISLTKK